MDQTMDKLEKYLRGLRKRGERVPSQVRGRNPHISVISAESGIPLTHLIKSPYRERITLAVRELGLKKTELPEAARLEHLFRQNGAALARYLEWLEKHGLMLPEDPKHTGKIFFAQVAVETGIKYACFSLKGTETDKSFRIRLRRVVESASARIGMEIRVLPQSPGDEASPITVKELFEKGTEERKKSLESRRGARQQLYNARSAFRRFCKSLGLDPPSPAGNEFTLGFKGGVDVTMGEIGNERSRKKFQTEINWWGDFYRRLLKEQFIPGDFHDALAYLVDRSGLSMTMLAKFIDIPAANLRGWRRGKITPSHQSLPALSRMESLFRLPAGTLTGRAMRWRLKSSIRGSQLPESVRRTPSLARRVSRHLPNDYLDQPVERRQEMVEYICSRILRYDDPYTERMSALRTLQYVFTDWPEPLEREFTQLASFKTADMPPLGMLRNKRWKPTTAEMVRRCMRQFFGALRLPQDAEDLRLRGLGVPVEHLTLALLACPLVVDWYVRFRCAARNTYTEFALRLLDTFNSILRPETGWLRQSPYLAARLRPLSVGSTHLVSTELVAKAQGDWGGVCDEAIRHYKHLASEITPLISVARNSFSRIEGILGMDDPTEAFGILLEGMANSLPTPRTHPVLYHSAIRDCALVGLIVLTGLRRNTVAQINYTGDAAGHLTFKGESYVLEIPPHLFKIEDSPFFGPKHAKMNYYTEIPDAFGFYDKLTEYLNVSRPFLIKHSSQAAKERALFVTCRNGKTGKISPRRISQIFSRAVERHLVENKYCGTGIPLVWRCGPHSARHIRATTTLKKGGSYLDAGNSIQNSERMARLRYSQFGPKDRNRDVNEILFGKKKK